MLTVLIQNSKYIVSRKLIRKFTGLLYICGLEAKWNWTFMLQYNLIHLPTSPLWFIWTYGKVVFTLRFSQNQLFEHIFQKYLLEVSNWNFHFVTSKFIQFNIWWLYLCSLEFISGSENRQWISTSSLTSVVCVALWIGSGSPLTKLGLSLLFWNFCGGGMVSILAGSCVRGNDLFFELLVFGRCTGETL